MSKEMNMFYRNSRGIGIWVSVISVIILSVSCSNNRKSDVMDGIIQFNQHGQYPLIDLKLSDIADVEYVKLKDSDSAFIFQPYFSRNTYVGDDYIIVGNYTARDYSNFGIYKFDRKGNYIDRITGFGRGPGEFASLAKMSVEADSSILLFSMPEHRVVRVNSSGKYLGQWNLPRGHSEAQLLGNSVIIYDRISKYISKNGQIVERGAPLKAFDLSTSSVTDLLTDEYTNGIVQDNREGPSSESKMFSHHKNLIKTKDGVYFSSVRFDTVYFINSNLEVIPKISVNKENPKRECYTVVAVIETDDYILLKDAYAGPDSWKSHNNYYIFLKSNNRIYQIRNDYIVGNSSMSHLFNDKISLDDTFLSLNHNLFTVYYTYDYIQELKDEIPEELQEVFSIVENDNPVLAIVKFRGITKKLDN